MSRRVASPSAPKMRSWSRVSCIETTIRLYVSHRQLVRHATRARGTDAVTDQGSDKTDLVGRAQMRFITAVVRPPSRELASDLRVLLGFALALGKVRGESPLLSLLRPRQGGRRLSCGFLSDQPRLSHRHDGLHGLGRRKRGTEL